MEFSVNDKLHGFTVTRVRPVEEFEGDLVEMVHDRTGAGLVWARCDEVNKLFSVGFKTLPEDSTGVFHILEHSVLCGSERFPVKEPFVELLKTSMNTFLNAMTFQDKTLYPVSSRMDQDYLNLMEVYLDAVFRPDILSNPNIFYQEGWHIDTDGDEHSFKGVVYNEMKGAMSDVDQVADRTMLSMLFPDNCYGFNSGGDPEVIPELTYDKFIETYKRYYHPSNAYFYLDGDIPVERTLEVIDSYLAGYEKLEDLPVINIQEPVVSDRVIRYETGEDGGKAMVVFAKIAGTWKDRDRLLALNVLTEQLADSNESPLKRAVLSSGLAEDMEFYVYDGNAQPFLMIMFRGVDPSALDLDEKSAEGLSYEDSVKMAADRLLEIYTETVSSQIKTGFPVRDLEASVNQLDFKARQIPEPQGLYRGIAALSSWLYGGDPAMYLRTNESIAVLRSMLLTEGSASRIAEEYLSDTSALSRLILLPSDTLGREKAEAEKQRVKDIICSMSEDQLAALEIQNDILDEWQSTPDSDEALASIPQLSLSDIDPVPELIGTEVRTTDGVTILYHHVPTNGIVNINAFYPITDLGIEDLSAAALITELLKDLPTENYDVVSLQREIKMYVGSLSFGIDINARDDDNSQCTPCLRARAAVLRENLSYAEDLMIEVLTRTKFTDISLMKEIIMQVDDECRRSAVSGGHKLALSVARSGWSSRDAAAEALNGYSFVRYMHRMSQASDDDIASFGRFAHDLIARAVIREGSYISITASEDEDISRYVSMLPSSRALPEAVSYRSDLPSRVGIAVPASVSFAIQSYDLSAAGLKPGGSLAVAANIVSLAYLWNEIRVKGGSYGASMSASRTGGILCYTYRDPGPAKSLDIYRTIPEFLSSFTSSSEDALDGFIISTIAGTEPLVSPASKGRSADDFWFSGFTDEDRIRIRKQIINTTAPDLAGWKESLQKFAEEGRICVVGPRQVLEAIPDLEIYSI